MESHAKTRRRKEVRDPGICDAVGRGVFGWLSFWLIALRLGGLSDSGREDRFLKGARKEVRMRRRWGMVGFAVVGLYEAKWMVVARDIPVDYK